VKTFEMSIFIYLLQSHGTAYIYQKNEFTGYKSKLLDLILDAVDWYLWQDTNYPQLSHLWVSSGLAEK
jgi:hypothetical protein